MRSFVCLALSLVPCVLALACDFPVSASKYEVDDEPVESVEPFEHVVAAFARGSTSCDECLRASCKPFIEACANTSACPEFAECVQEEANPAGQARCASQYDHVSLATLVPYADMRACWAKCESDCNIGRDWGCLGGYKVTHPPRETITVQQSLSYVCQGGPVLNALVTVCVTEEHCNDQVETDAAGSYTVKLPIPRKTLAGWRGFRRVTGGILSKPHRLQRNLPIWTDQVESTALMSDYCAAVYEQTLASEVGPADWGAVLSVQLFDCQMTGAEGVVLEIETAPDARIVYVGSDRIDVSFPDDSSKAAGEGLALIAHVPPGDHELVAYESTSGKRLAKASLTVTGEELILYNLYPEPEPEPVP